MRNVKQIVVSTLFATIFGAAAVAQTTYATSNGQNGTTITYAAPGLAMRQNVQNMVEELTAAGFTYIEVRQTFMGRARFIAYSATKKREVVINPTTGEVLRDLSVDSAGAPQINANAGGQGAGNNGNGNGNSGSNNGNSGNGNNGNGNGNSGNGNNGNGGNGNNGNGNGNN